ncbi:restriction endonuclease subunit S [Aliivibrio sp. S10_S31]|uniref:restriction endonuclease subunit S n=1 Tax=Aliivibrio sp. S10_S31 TaxID=2720224 RepID=UPI00167FF2A4|nr:restriction endonuclease subunit S [Aliivibrio sp. S10_S31]MBD1569785.1 restriction endonuclease subunit S [Aliivibrio sp. S10_S31]
MVPNGWKKSTVGSIAKVTSGGTPSRKNDSYWNGDIPWVTTSEVKFGVIADTEQKITKQGLDNSSAKLFPKDTILMAMYGQGKTRGQVAKLGIEASTNQACAALLLNKEHDVEYYYQYLMSQYDNIRELANSGGQQNLSAGIIKDISVPVPPLSEQRKIAQILSTWNRGIATTEKLIDASKQQKKALMQQLLTGKKRLVDPETGKAFEGEWERHSLSDLVYVDRKSLGKKTPDNFKFRYISLSNVDFGVISKELEVHEFSAAPSRARRVLQDGDTLMSTVRPNLKGFAKVTSCYADCIASTGFAVLTPKKKVSGDYIYQYIFSAHVTGQIDSLVVGSNYPAINSSDVSGLKIYCPAFEEQQKIASVLTAADKEIELLEAKLAHLKQEKKALMQQLLTGKRRVQVEAA